MTDLSLLIIIALIGLFAFSLSRQRALLMTATSTAMMKPLPRHYGYLTAAHTVLPSLLVAVIWLLAGEGWAMHLALSSLPDSFNDGQPAALELLENRILIASIWAEDFEQDAYILSAAHLYEQSIDTGRWLCLGIIALVSALGLLSGYRRTRLDYNARETIDAYIKVALRISSYVAILTTIGIVFSLVLESSWFFSKVPISDFLFGTKWSPQVAMRADQVGSSGSFGALPLFAGTLLIALVAILVAGPIGLMTAIYLTQYASTKTRATVKPILEILAGIPTVVYGFFAAVLIAPALRSAGLTIGLNISSESALAAGIVMGIMIIPFVSSLTDDAIAAVPDSMTDGSLALGATNSETITRVLIPASLHGIVGALLLAISRAIGETMIVVMAAGLSPNLTFNPLESVTTVTTQIVALLTGDQEFDSAKTLSAFALGLALFTVTLLFNIFAQHIVRRYRETYE